jgi:hypothetical protein
MRFFWQVFVVNTPKIMKYPKCEAGLALSVPPPRSAQGKLRDFGRVLTLNFLTSALRAQFIVALNVFRNLTKGWLYAEYPLPLEDPATSAWCYDDIHLSTGKECFPLNVS